MKRYNKNRILAGVFAMLFVLQASTAGATVFADETAAPDTTVTAAADTAEDTITLTGAFTMPAQLTQGMDVEVIGAVTSANSLLTSVSVAVYNSTGNFETGGTVNPNADSYDISKLDSKVDFKSLTPGTYTIAVIASNAAKSNETLLSKQFEVAAALTTDTITLSEEKTEIPASFSAGTEITLKGTVTSADSALQAVAVGVYNADGTRVTGASGIPQGKTYDISALSSVVHFEKLEPGSYTFRLTATNASNSEVTLQEVKFTVTEAAAPPAATNDSLTVTGMSAIPDTLKKGNIVNIRGTLKSGTSLITSVSCGVYDASGKLVTGRSASPRTQTFDLSRLDPYVTFDKLEAGEYTFSVIATNTANANYTVYTKKFTVTADTSTPTVNDTIASSGVTTIPENLRKGQAVSVRGTVTSVSSNLTGVTAGVYDESGKLVTGRTVDLKNAKSKTFDLHTIDRYILFNSLTDGKYTFKVIASNASKTDITVFEKAFTVGTGTAVTPVASEDKMTVSDLFTMPDSIKKGQAVSVTGKASSAVSDFTSLTVGVYDESGNFKTGRTVDPKAKTYDLRNLDRYVTFNTLTDGVYTFAVIASNASKSNETLYSKKFTVGTGTSTATQDTLTLTNLFTVPDSIKPGTSVKVTGTVTSAVSNITSVTAGVYNSKNELVTGKTVSVNAKTFDLKTVDRAIVFGSLKEDDYTFRVYATNSAKNNEQLVSKSFKVTSGQTPAVTTDDTLTLSGGTTIPDTLKPGQTLSIGGTVTSAKTDMTSLTCGVYDGNGKFVTGKTINPRAKTYDLKKLDYAVEFNKLPEGTYTYAVIASNGGNSNFTILSKKFTIGSGTAAPAVSDTLTITGGTNVPNNLSVGQAVRVTGTVTSASSNMTSLTCGVYDANGKFVTGRTVNPGAKTYDLSKLDAYVLFNKLPAGSYVYAVIATNGGNANFTLVSKSFTVGSGTAVTPTTNDALTITGGTNVPDTLAVGKALSIFGTVTSASSNMTSLTCGVYDANGKFVTGRTINPNAKSYDLKKLDAYVEFNKLPAGSYTYAVIASNAGNSNYTIVSKKFTVGSGSTSTTATSTVTLTGGTTVPSTVTRGKGVIVRGTVTSSDALQRVTITIRQKGSDISLTGASASPNATTYNLNALDSQVRFDRLAAGTYEYIVTATTKSGTQTLTTQTFVVQ